MRIRAAVLVAVAAAIGAASLGLAIALSPTAAAFAPTPVLSRIVLGHSVQGRPIVAYRLGDPRARTTAVILGQMHGDEPAGRTVVNSLRRGTVSVEGIDLWVIPTMNPDGAAAHRRQNAHHVDLNRNWPRHWTPLTGQYYSGPRPLSEPETRAMYAFLRRVRPHYLISLHQPLFGVDTTDGGAADRALRRRLVDNLRLPAKALRCWSSCHGSMTNWYTAHYGIGETVEFGWHPSRAYLTGTARRGIVAAIGGHFGRLPRHNPRAELSAGTGEPQVVRLTGWAYDIDARGRSLPFTVRRDGRVVDRGSADLRSPDVDARYHLSGRHGLDLTVRSAPGRHSFCLVFDNAGAGTADTRRCVAVRVSPPSTSNPAPSSTA